MSQQLVPVSSTSYDYSQPLSASRELVPQSLPTAPQQPQKPALEDILLQYMSKQDQSIQRIEQRLNQMEAEREKGRFPSQPVPNPKGNSKEPVYEVTSSSNPPPYHAEAKSVTTLRSGL